MPTRYIAREMRSITTTVVLLGTRDTIRKLVKQFRARCERSMFSEGKKNRSTKIKNTRFVARLDSSYLTSSMVCIVGVYDNSVGAIVGRGWWLYGGAVKSD